MWSAKGVDYSTIGDSVENVRDAITLAVGCGVVYLIVVTTALGWWKPALREPRRAHLNWAWTIPALLSIGVIANLLSTKWDRVDNLGTYALWLGLGCAFVGFSEELVTRGLLIVGARGSVHEGWVWFISSLCFGLLHVPNVFYGQSGKETAQQVAFAFGVGSAYYVVRRISGLLVVTMVLHGAWDFSVFLQDHSVADMVDKPVGFGGIVMSPVIVLALIAVWRLHRNEGDVVAPGTDQLAALGSVAT